ncbi:MAG: hypothetical protein Q8881_03825 [Sweet potato little leaf phytoplasma]|nr:hypothetical protein [Sweet potato little leaf phytoplasma]
MFRGSKKGLNDIFWDQKKGLWVSHSGTFLPNFALGDVSDETTESIPPNFVLETFSTKRPDQPRRISTEFCTRGRLRRNGGINPAEFRTRGHFRQNGRNNPSEFDTRGRFRRNG